MMGRYISLAGLPLFIDGAVCSQVWRDHLLIHVCLLSQHVMSKIYDVVLPSQLIALQFARLSFSLHPPIKRGWPTKLRYIATVRWASPFSLRDTECKGAGPPDTGVLTLIIMIFIANKLRGLLNYAFMIIVS